MKSFFKLASITLQGRMYYRIGFLLNLFTPLVVLAGQFLLWSSLYGGEADAEFAGYTRGIMFTHMLFSFCINNLLNWSSENTLSREILSGSVVARCVRPASFLNQSMASFFGNILPQSIVNFSVCLLALLVFRRFFVLPSPAVVPLFLCSLVLAVLLRMLLVHVFSLLCFYTTSHLGISWTRRALNDLFSGAIIPLALFPGWLQTVSFYQPFPFMLQIPLSILLGQDLPMPVYQTFLVQILWIGFFLLLHRLIYGHVRKNMTFAGG